MIIKIYGKKKWAIPGGFIPLHSTGKEPAFISNDKVSVLNVTHDEALLKITIYFEDEEPAGVFELKVKPRSVFKFRVNDLIDPHAIPLGKNYSLWLESEVPVVVQFTKQQTGSKYVSLMGTMAFPVD